MPPGIRKSMNSTVAAETNFSCAAAASWGPVSPSNLGLWVRRKEIIFSLMSGWFQVALTEVRTASELEVVNPAKQRMMDGMTVRSKGWASKVMRGRDQTRRSRILSVTFWGAPWARNVNGAKRSAVLRTGG